MKKKTSLFLAIIMIISSLFIFAGCGGSDEGSSDDTDNTFKVGMECDYAPYNWTQAEEGEHTVALDGGGFASGYDVLIAQKIADGLGKELVIVKTSWDGLIPALTSGKIDAIIAGMSPTEERKASIDFSNPYYESELVMVVKKDGPFASATSIADFTGAKITGQLNTFHYSVIEQIQGVDQQTAMETFPAMIVALNAGKIDGYVSERPGAESAVAANADLSYVEFADGSGFEAREEDAAISVGLAKEQADLVAQINTIIDGITKDERQQLMDLAIEIQPITE